MAKKQNTNSNDFTDKLVGDLNKKLGDEVAFLVDDGSPSDVKVFVPTGSKLLDFILTNREDGGWPVGKISEVTGLEGTGKSLLAMAACANAQKMGALVVYIDTESAIQTEFANRVGLDLNNNFIWMNPATVEDVFTSIFTLVHKIEDSEKTDKKSPYSFVFVVWDSIAGTPVARDISDEDPNPNATVGIKSRLLSKNITNLIKTAARKNMAFLSLNQLRTKIGASPFEDPYVAPGGKAVPFYSSVRVRISNKGKVKIGSDVVGIQVKCKCVKTRFCGPYRECEFPLYFSYGIDDEESIIDELVKRDCIKTKAGGSKGKLFYLDSQTSESAMTKVEFKKLMKTDEKFRTILTDMLAKEMIVNLNVLENEISVEELDTRGGET